MQLFSTTRGVARRDADALLLLETTYSELHEAIVASDVASLGDAPVRAEVPYEDASLLPPVRPRRLGQIGLNYRSHLEEIGMPERTEMMYAISPMDDTLNGPDSVVTLPAEAPDHVDHECEIALVIGAACANVAKSDAWDVIAGVTACNDVSARDVQRDGIARGERTAGKMLPGFKPLGPGLLTADEARLGPIGLRLTVNGVERQNSDTDDMVFTVPEIIATITAEQPLEPGDVIITGSPAGVGVFEGRFLRHGDVVEVFVGGLPPLRNTIERG